MCAAAPIAGAWLCASFGTALAEAQAPRATPPTAPPSQAQSSAASPAQPAAAPQPKFDLDAYDVDGNTLLDTPTVEAAVYPFLGPDRTREDRTSVV